MPGPKAQRPGYKRPAPKSPHPRAKRLGARVEGYEATIKDRSVIPLGYNRLGSQNRNK